MATRTLNDLEDYIRDKVEREHLTQSKISERLKARFPGTRGFSARSIRRFCQEKGIQKTSRLSQADVEEVVAEGVSKVFNQVVVVVPVILLVLIIALTKGSSCTRAITLPVACAIIPKLH